MTPTILHGDMLALLPTLPADSIDAVVTDPPYHLTSIVKRFGSPDAAPAQFGTDGAFARAPRGFMGKQWDGGDIAFRPETWRAVWRVMRPGAHLLAFGGSRTFHRMACAVEDAGFELRDTVFWLYGSGFPKSLNVSKAIDRAAGAEREVVGVAGRSGSARSCMAGDFTGGDYYATSPATEDAARWQGWGTALKPAVEPIILARKPLVERTVAAQVLATGTGALNIDACRVATAENLNSGAYSGGKKRRDDATSYYTGTNSGEYIQPSGRWPANLVHDGSDEVLAAFATFGESKSTAQVRHNGEFKSVAKGRELPHSTCGHADSGTAARFFYCAKANKADRAGSRHPTIKPIALIRWLVRLITPPGGTVLDPFAGTGTTGAAALAEGFDSILIEREAEYVEDMRRRFAAKE